MSTIKISMGNHQADYEKACKDVEEQNIINRIWGKDHTVWNDDPTEISNRLGWLDSTKTTMDSINEITDFVQSIQKGGFTHALLLGMGGSSLAPEVLRFTFGVNDGFLDLSVLDSTDPGAVLDYSYKLNPAKTLYIVSTKSGGTVETLSFTKYFYTCVSNKIGADKVGNHFIAITDPGSGLESMARQLKFRKVFLNDPNIGGRYSALSFFGMVPAALVGINLTKFIERANKAVVNSHETIESNAAAKLGVAIGDAANVGIDKLTFIMSNEVSFLGVWIEQLIAESTGKIGKGIVPVVDEEILSPDGYSRDRIFVHLKIEGDTTNDGAVKQLLDAGFPVIELTMEDIYDLGTQFFTWEFATVIAGWRIGIQPFDQPDVESAKVQAKEMINQYRVKGELPSFDPILKSDGMKFYGDITGESINELLEAFMSKLVVGKDEFNGRSYVALQAFIKPDESTSEALQELRTLIQEKYKVAVTTGYGPRFLHSTGQLHKGDAGNGLFIQFTAAMLKDASIPDNPGASKSSVSFGILKTAQALGDRNALLHKNRNVLTIDLGDDIVSALKLIGSKI